MLRPYKDGINSLPRCARDYAVKRRLEVRRLFIIASRDRNAAFSLSRQTRRLGFTYGTEWRRL